MTHNQIMQEIELQAELYIAAKHNLTVEQVGVINDYTEYLIGMLGIMAEPTETPAALYQETIDNAVVDAERGN